MLAYDICNKMTFLGKKLQVVCIDTSDITIFQILIDNKPKRKEGKRKRYTGYGKQKETTVTF